MEFFSWYVFGGWVICFPTLLFLLAKRQNKLTVSDVLVSLVGGLMPFFRELIIFMFLDVGNIVVWKKSDEQPSKSS